MKQLTKITNIDNDKTDKNQSKGNKFERKGQRASASSTHLDELKGKILKHLIKRSSNVNSKLVENIVKNA